MAKFLYEYHEERGEFRASLTDENGKEVWSVKYPDYYEDELTGELMEGSTIFEDGFMRNVDDISGLEKYMKSMGVLKADDEVVSVDEDRFDTGGEIKNKLNNVVKKSDNGLALEYEFAVYVPSTESASQIINRKEFQRRIDEVQAYLSGLFGGFSSSNVDGGYYSNEKGLIQEDVVRVVAFATKDAAKKNLPALISQLGMWAEKWGQEAIGLEFEGDLFYVDKKTRLNRGGFLNKSLRPARNAFNKRYDLANESLRGFYYNGGETKNRTYFSTLAEVFEMIHSYAEDNGYEVVSIFPDITYGGISYGETKRVNVEVSWNGKEKRGKSKKRETNNIIASIYRMDSGNYELVMYFAYNGGGEIKFEIINELDSDDVDDFFDGDTKEIQGWSEGKGRGQTNYTIYTDGKKYILDREDFGFDDFKHNYFNIKIKDGVIKRKSGNEAKVQRKVDELNRLIKLANENDLAIVDTSGTWQTPEKYKPVRYVNGVLYFEWEELDLYSYNKERGEKWNLKKDKVLKSNMEFDGIPTLNTLMRLYKKSLKQEGITF